MLGLFSKNGLFANPTNGEGAGSVTTVSVLTANGLSGTVANPTSTPAISIFIPPIAVNSDASYIIDPANAGQFDITLNSATPTLTMQNVIAGKGARIPVTIIQDGIGGRLPSWSNITWVGVTPTVASGIAARTYLEFISDGITWTGYAVNQSVGTGPQVLAVSPTITTPTISGTLTTADVQGASILITGNQINQTSTNSDTGEQAINYRGYNNGISVFRIYTVYDGKQNPIMILTGSDKSAVFSGSVQGFAPTNYQTGTTYTFVLGDTGKRISLTNAFAITATVPPAGSVAYSAETEIILRQGGAGQVTVAPGSGVTINSYGSLTKLAGQYAYGSLKLSSTANTWDLFGNLG